MANIINTIRAYNALYLVVDGDPSVAPGTLAGIYSLAIDYNGLVYRKFGYNDTDWELLVNPAQTPGPPGPPGPTGPVDGYCGSFLSTQTQTNSGADTLNFMSCDTTIISNGVSLLNSNEFHVNFTGNINIQFSAQVNKTNANKENLNIWLMRNGNDEFYSDTTLVIPGNGEESFAAWNFLVPVNSGDYFQIAWASHAITLQLLARLPTISPSRPGIPSVIITLIQAT